MLNDVCALKKLVTSGKIFRRYDLNMIREYDWCIHAERMQPLNPMRNKQNILSNQQCKCSTYDLPTTDLLTIVLFCKISGYQHKS